MCGIAGFYDPRGGDAEAAKSTVRAMADRLVHRGPDASGVWTDPAGIALGFRRLAILDLSEHGHQPMHSASGRHVIAFNGEIYNHAEFRAELAATGHAFRGHSDTEALLESIERFGLDATLQRATGMFAFALWDRRERTLTLARDRFGEKPLYWARGTDGHTILFASELKALRASPRFDASIDRHALKSFTRYGYVPSPHCIYRGAHKLDAGSWLQLGADAPAPRQERYYSIERVAEAGLRAPLAVGLDEAADLVEAELGRAVEQQMVADVPLGAFLSGGIDSTVVVALMQRRSSRPVRTFTIGFDAARYDEAPFARAVSAHLGTEHVEFRVTGQDALAIVPDLPHVYDEPFSDSSQVPTTLVSRLARQHVTVVLTGDGGDEVFSGYPRYEMLRKLERPFALPGRAWLAERAHRTLGWLARAGTAPTLDRRLVDWAMRRSHALRLPDLDAFYRLYMSLWPHPEWVVPDVEEAPSRMPLPSDVLAAGNVTERAMLADFLQNLPDDLLPKVDRAAMSTSLETRLPMLDHRLVELAWRLPYATKVAGPTGKLVLRRILAKHVPTALFERPKMGFMVPIVDWLRGPLRDWAESLLTEQQLRDGMLEPAIIRRRWSGFLAGTKDWYGLIWLVLMWQSWRQAWGVRA